MKKILVTIFLSFLGYAIFKFLNKTGNALNLIPYLFLQIFDKEGKLETEFIVCFDFLIALLIIIIIYKLFFRKMI